MNEKDSQILKEALKKAAILQLKAHRAEHAMRLLLITLVIPFGAYLSKYHGIFVNHGPWTTIFAAIISIILVMMAIYCGIVCLISLNNIDNQIKSAESFGDTNGES